MKLGKLCSKIWKKFSFKIIYNINNGNLFPLLCEYFEKKYGKK